MRMSFRLVMTLLLPLALARCGDPEEKPQPGVSEYTVGGTVTGLKGSGLVLRYGDETLGVPNDGSFTFARKAVAGTAYAVSVETQPSGPPQACTVTNGSGTLGSANVTDVTVTCGTAAFKVGGTVTGLVGTGLKLKNGTETLNVAANGAFQFATPLETGVAYAVTVSTQPTGPAQRCTVSGGEGIMGGADVTSVTVNCDTSKFTVGGTVSGLNGTLVLGNGTQEVTLTGTGSSANTSFAFPTGYETGTAYDVKVKTAPAAQDCTITRGTGTVGSANVTNVAVACVTRAYLVNVTVSGLVGTLVVKNNDTDSLTFTTNETKAFNNRVAEGGTYFVTVGTQPATQTCTSEQAAAAPIGTANVTVKVTCVTNQYFLGGSVSGLGAGESVTLANGTQETTVSTNGAFQFAQKVDQGAAYTVTVKTAPAGKQCGVSNGTGTVGAGDVTNVSVVCSASTYTVGGNLSGLGTGGTVKLRNNGGDELDPDDQRRVHLRHPAARGRQLRGDRLGAARGSVLHGAERHGQRPGGERHQRGRHLRQPLHGGGHRDGPVERQDARAHQQRRQRPDRHGRQHDVHLLHGPGERRGLRRGREDAARGPHLRGEQRLGHHRLRQRDERVGHLHGAARARVRGACG
ncbi:hypothetical protein [Melittangium boletus]|uniref:hypothetical protein n=1 Tax=Melittangium boletus TaxID=83453 RepID=UPI003DA6A461